MKLYGGQVKTLSRTYDLDGEFYFVVIVTSLDGYCVQVRKTHNIKKYSTNLVESQFHENSFEANCAYKEFVRQLQEEEMECRLFA